MQKGAAETLLLDIFSQLIRIRRHNRPLLIKGEHIHILSFISLYWGRRRLKK